MRAISLMRKRQTQACYQMCFQQGPLLSDRCASIMHTFANTFIACTYLNICMLEKRQSDIVILIYFQKPVSHKWIAAPGLGYEFHLPLAAFFGKFKICLFPSNSFRYNEKAFLQRKKLDVFFLKVVRGLT